METGLARFASFDRQFLLTGHRYDVFSRDGEAISSTEFRRHTLLIDDDTRHVEISDGDQGTVSDAGVVTSRSDDLEVFAKAFVDAIAAHRHWDRSSKTLPA